MKLMLPKAPAIIYVETPWGPDACIGFALLLVCVCVVLDLGLKGNQQESHHFGWSPFFETLSFVFGVSHICFDCF